MLPCLCVLPVCSRLHCESVRRAGGSTGNIQVPTGANLPETEGGQGYGGMTSSSWRQKSRHNSEIYQRYLGFVKSSVCRSSFNQHTRSFFIWYASMEVVLLQSLTGVPPRFTNWRVDGWIRWHFQKDCTLAPVRMREWPNVSFRSCHSLQKPAKRHFFASLLVCHCIIVVLGWF